MATRTARTNGRATAQTAEDLSTEPLVEGEDAPVQDGDGDGGGTDEAHAGESIDELGNDGGDGNGDGESDEQPDDATVLFFPMASMSEGQSIDEPTGTAFAQPAFPAFTDTVEAMHHCNGQLAKLLLALPVAKMSRAITSALGEEAAAQWRQQFEQAQQQRTRIADQIVEQAMQSSLGIR